MSLRIAIAVHGRFHAFELARALLSAGHDVTVFTNLPRFATRRAQLEDRRVRSMWPHGLVQRALGRASSLGLPGGEALLHRAFGAWAARALTGTRWDLVLVFSGVAEELLRAPAVTGLKVVVRGSCHIRRQDRLLREEEARAATPIDRPSAWRIAREEREYSLADRVCVLSGFARRSFVEEGLPPDRVWLNPLALPVERFTASPEALAARTARLRAGGPLRVLTVGHVSFRKGLLDLLAAARRLRPDEVDFRWVGLVLPEARGALERPPAHLDLRPPCPQAEVAHHLAWADLFLLPTIEDGFAVVLAEALAAGVPILTTPHSGGPDLLAQNDRSGWLIPIRDPDAIVARLRAIQADRVEHGRRAAELASHPPRRSWRDVADGIAGACLQASGAAP